MGKTKKYHQQLWISNFLARSGGIFFSPHIIHLQKRESKQGYIYILSISIDTDDKIILLPFHQNTITTMPIKYPEFLHVRTF